jgi:hypothetical protein
MVGGFGWGFAFRRGERQVGETGEIPQSTVAEKARRKLLKTERLVLFQNGPKLPIFRRVVQWPKRETDWSKAEMRG